MSANFTGSASPRMGATLLLAWVVAVILWWGFAFVPVPPGVDSWLAVAQAACFGSRPGGMPALHGWMMLTLAPLLMLACLWAVFRDDLRSALPYVARTPLPRLIATLLVLTFAAEVGLAGQRLRTAGRVESFSFEPAAREPLPEGYPRTSREVPAFALVDQRGSAFTQADLPGEPIVMSFVFAHCQTVCPILVRTLKKARVSLGQDGTRMALVTLDPWRDTPAALPGLATTFEVPDGARLLSGAPDDVCRLLDTLGVARTRDLQSGDVNHAPIVMVLDRAGRIAYTFNNPPAEWIVEAVRRCRRPV
ncbi:MAG: SCO family protein [Candidatus Eisenbacteria bacterium]|nr:SCO family protein [Candidatus Eisenbacteria bacterium]